MKHNGGSGDPHVSLTSARWAVALLAAAVGFLLAGGSAGAEPSVSPLYWSGAFQAVTGGPLGEIACSSTPLCVSPDGAGDVVWATNPFVEPQTWQVTSVPGSAAATGRGISCTATPVCVAIGPDHVMTSGDPTGGSAAWKIEPLDETATLNDVSCVAPSLCVAVDSKGHVLTSAQPTLGASAWSSVQVDGENDITSISCTAPSLCVAFDEKGNVLSSSNPAGGPGAWNVAHLTSGAADVSCTAGPFCAAVRGSEILTSSNPTGGPGTWTVTDTPGELGKLTCSAAGECLAAPPSTNGGLEVSEDVQAGKGTWVAGSVGSRVIHGIGCATPTSCVATVESGSVMVSTARHTLSLSLPGAGRGRVTSSTISCPWASCSHTPPGLVEPLPLNAIACENIVLVMPSGTCALGFPEGNIVTLTAVPAPGSWFTGWGGECRGRSCTLSMNTARSVAARFEPQFTVCTASAPRGCCDCVLLVRLRLSDLHETHPRFTAARPSTSLTGKASSARVPQGTQFGFRLTRNATVKIKIRATRPGRREGNRCAAPSRGLESHAHCARHVTVATLTRAAHYGLNHIPFTGRIKHKALQPGNYQAVFIATDTFNESAKKSIGFRIVRP